MKNKKLVLALIALLAVCAFAAGIWFATRPTPSKNDSVKQTQLEDGTIIEVVGNSFTVVVVHGDGTTKEFSYTTDADYLGGFLYEEGLIVADESNPGMFHTVDGEKADWNENQSYWAFYEGDQYAVQGIETTPITDGAVYKLVYTVGF